MAQQFAFQVGSGRQDSVVAPFPGQGENYCGVQACTAFSSMLLNVLDPKRYSKVAAMATVTAGTGVTFAAQSLVAFADNVGDTATTNTNFPFALTKAETDYTKFENPVPQNSNMLFCAVGMTAVIGRPYFSATETPTVRDYPAWLTQAADYRETAREELYNNIWLSISYGNNGCTYDIGLLCHYPNPNSPHGGDVVAPGVIAMPLSFTPFNAVLCIDSLNNNRRAVLNVNYEHGATIDQTSLTIATSGKLYAPIEFALFGFVIGTPDASAIFVGTVAGK